MSTVSGLASKGEKGSKQKYSALNINNLYKGKSLENPKTTVAPKHGLQTLGKVGAGRRIPPPANLPSLKSENAGNNPSINLVPSGGQGWVKEKEENATSIPVSSNSLTTQRIPSPKLTSNQETTVSMATNTTLTVSPSVASNANVIATGAASAALSKTWSSVTHSQEEDGHGKNFLAHQSPFFPQEFPKLDGGAVQEGEMPKQNVDSSYGPGPSLRPQTEGSWTRGTATQQQQQYSGNQQVSNGSGVNGQQSVSPPESDLSGVPRGYQPSMTTVIPVPPRGPVPANIPIMSSGGVAGPPNLLPTGHAPILPMSPQYRPMVSPYIYNRNSGYQAGYPSSPQMQNYPGSMPQRPTYPYSESRVRQQQLRTPEEEGSYQRPTPPILSDKDLRGFDEILENETYDEWAVANAEIDYNAKLVFSDDEENGVSKDESKILKEEKSNVSQKERTKNERDLSEKESDKEERPKYRPPQQQWQGSTSSRHYDYRGSASSSHTTPIPFNNAPTTTGFTPPSLRTRSDLPDEDELWRQRSRQHSDEMTAAVARARQRREEEEKKFEQSRQAAQEKAKALEEKAKNNADKDKSDIVESDDSKDRKSKEIRDDKQAKDFRNIAANFNSGSGFANKQFPKNMPPRFQKLQQQQMQLQQQQQQQQQQQPLPNNVTNFAPINRYEHQLVSNSRATYENAGYSDFKTHPGFSKMNESQSADNFEAMEAQWRERQKNLQDNWRLQKDSTISRSESLRSGRSSSEEIGTQLVRVQSRNAQHSDENRNERSDNFFTNVQRPDSRSSFSSREENRSKFDENKPSFERQESSQSSQSDKRSSSSRDDKSKKYERLDWASECDNVSIASSNSSTHFGSMKKDWHRPVPITQKQLNAVSEPVKKNLTTLRKEESKKEKTDQEIYDQERIQSSEEKSVSQSAASEDMKNSNVQINKVETKELTSVTTDNKDLQLPCNTVAEPKKEEVEIKEASKKSKENAPKNAEKASAKSETSQDRKNHKRGEERGMKDRDSHFDSRERRDYDYRHANFRGREYRRSRGPGDKMKSEKFGKGSSYGSRKLSKSRKQSHNSEENISIEDAKKDKTQKSSPITFETKKGCNEPSNSEKQMNENSNVTSSRDEFRKSNRANSFRNTRGLGRSYGPSNYGPPPSKAAFGDTKNVSYKSGEKSTESKPEKSSQEPSKTEIPKAVSKESANQTNSSAVVKDTPVSNNTKSANIIRNQKDNSSFRSRAANPSDVNVHRTEEIPPRFQKKGNYRSGRGSKHHGGGGGNRSDRGRRQRTLSNQESDIGNDEWETASESSDVGDRKEERSNKNERVPAQNQRHESKPNKRNEKRKDSKGRQQQSQRSQSNRNQNHGHMSSPNPNRQNQSSVKNGPSVVDPKTDDSSTLVLAVSNVIIDNPRVVNEAITDLKTRQKTGKSKNHSNSISNYELEDGFQKVSYKKRFKNAVGGNETKKLKHDIVLSKPKLNARSRYTKLPPRLAKQKENTRLNKLSNDGFIQQSQEDENSPEPKSQSETASKNDLDIKNVKESNTNMKGDQTVNAWAKPLSHAIQAVNSTMVTTVAGVTKSNLKNSNQQQLSLSSKSSSFDQQDSGIDVSDQPASAASSQRSSPSNDDSNKATTKATVPTTCVTTTSKESVSDLADDLDAGKPMCTVIFQNKNLKAENAVLDKFGNPQDKNTEVTLKQTVVDDSSSSRPMPPSPSNECSAKEDFSKMDEEENAKLGFNFKEEKATTTKVVNKAVGTPRNSNVDLQKNTAISQSADELNQHLKIASVKKVWENLPSMPAVLENNNEECTSSSETLTNKYDNSKTKQATINTETSNTLTSLASVHTAMTSAHTWGGNVRHAPVTSQDANKMKPHSYSQPMNNQLPQSLLFSSSPPNIANPMTSPLDGLRQIPNYHVTGLPPISSPPNLIYNTQTQMTNSAPPNIYSLAHPFKNFPQMMAQIVSAQAAPSPAYPQHLMSHQSNTLGQQNIYVPQPTQPAVNQTAADRFRMNPVHQQNLAASHLLKTPYVHQPSTQPVQGLHRIPVATSNAFYSNQGQTNAAAYFQQAGSTLQQQQYGYASAQPQLISAPGSQVAPQQSYRTVPITIGRTGVENSSSRPPNSKYNYR
ncbi:protein PRRC2C-like isoform X7 [Dinothrombium tinctorium]|uniref:Protein PRRC2C-like isoform X7 n=1 Tax=Dinothrombium tinctorium TaxID=1965070 RepID=A0A3S3PQE5_9ACAR|nr:protein PRRC2C-like isoform X7 [Dinothrombium tinctorium]